jgi:SAM-dependent methyltransferase
LWTEWRHGRGWRRPVWRVARPLLKLLGSDRGGGDDWNSWWAKQFDHYQFLPENLGDYVELGCGPYTNTRLILRGRHADRVVCSDPLSAHYVHFRGRWLADAHRKGLVEVDDHPIEELPFPRESFDVVVLVNVLDHVEDADVCLATATGLVRQGGYFVFGQDLVAAGADETLDIGHPIRLSPADVEPYLEPFTAVVRKFLAREQSRNPSAHEGTLMFAGRKLN